MGPGYACTQDTFARARIRPSVRATKAMPIDSNT